MRKTAAIVCVLQMACISAQERLTCTFGDNLSSSTPASFRSGLLLNTANPSVCFGIATRWNVCYFVSDTDPISTTYFGVYRPSAAGDGGFSFVSATNFTVPRVGNSSSYSCTQLPLDTERRFLVHPGDVVAVCVRYIGNGRLGLVGTTQTLHMLGNEGIDCLSPGRATPPVVSQITTGAYQLALVAHVNLDTVACLMSNGACDPTCANGTTPGCSFGGGTQPAPQTNGSQSLDANSSAPKAQIIYGIVGSTCAGIFIVVASVLLLISISYCVLLKRMAQTRDNAAIRRAETEVVPQQPYMELQISGHAYETLTPAVDANILTRKNCTCQEYECPITTTT